jgi:predicted SAM-dependent methyltransferase
MPGKHLNLGCGAVFVESFDWVNLDYSPASPSVIRADLLTRLPFDSDSFSAVYSSHFLEHVPKPSVPPLLAECFRVLEPGGTLRLVLPDFENMARAYLSLRESGEHEKADFVILEIIDQAVRMQPGGQLGRQFEVLRGSKSEKDLEMVGFVRERVGENIAKSSKVASTGKSGLSHKLLRVQNLLGRLWVRACVSALPAAFQAQNVSLAEIGERHHWLWDLHQLQKELESAGFTAVQRRSAQYSGIEAFPFHPLDIDDDGLPRKGSESMFVEAVKPSL